MQANSWTDCSALLPGFLSFLLLALSSPHSRALQPPGPQGNGIRRGGPAPGRAVPAGPGGLGGPGWQSPEQQGLIASSCSMYHSHAFPEGLQSKGAFPSFSSITTDCSWACCLHRLPAKSPAELYHHSHLKRVGQNYFGFTTATASTIWAVGWVRPALKWHLLNKPTASAGCSTATCPAFPPESAKTSIPTPSSGCALQIRPCVLDYLLVRTKNPLQKQISCPTLCISKLIFFPLPAANTTAALRHDTIQHLWFLWIILSPGLKSL